MKLHLKLAKFFISAISAVAVLTFASCASTKAEKNKNAIAGAQVELVETEQANSSATGEIFKSVLRLDTHLHVDVPMEDKDLPWSEKVDLKSAMEKAGYNAVVMTFAVDYVTLKYPCHAYKRFLNALDAQKKILDDSGLSLTLTSGQLEENFKNGEPIVIQAVEGGHFLEGDISRLKVAYDKGLRVLDILHDNDAAPALGDVYTNKEVFGGLTDFGKQIVMEAQKMGILVDLAHGSEKTVRDALEIATKPVVISHTGLNTRLGNNEKMAQMFYPRLISESLAKDVAAKGGVISVWTHLADTPAEYAANIKAMADLVGIDHVAIGTDSKITKEYQEFTDEMLDRQKEMEAKGEKMNFPKQDLNAKNHIWNGEEDNFYCSTIRELAKLGYSKEKIGKITGGNFARVFKEATE